MDLHQPVENSQEQGSSKSKSSENVPQDSKKKQNRIELSENLSGGDKEKSGNENTGYLHLVKDLTVILVNIFTVLAIIVGGWWFIYKREAGFRGNIITHEISDRLLNDEWGWVNVSIIFENAGETPLRLSSGEVWIQQVLPLENSFSETLESGRPLVPKGAHNIAWPLYGGTYNISLDVRIAPKEMDRLEFDFLIPCYFRTIRIYSYFEKQVDPKLGWSKSSIYDLTFHQNEGSKCSN